MSAYIEVTISWLFKNFRGRDAKLFTTTPAFASHPIPTISVTSPDCGETGAQLGVEYTFDGAGKFPALKWQAPEEVKDAIKEWLLVTEDPDAPLPTPIAHGSVVASVAPRIFRPAKLMAQDLWRYPADQECRRRCGF